MKLPEETVAKMPPHLQALLVKLPNPGRDEVVGMFPVVASGRDTVKRQSSVEAKGNQGAAYGAESRAAGTPMIFYGDKGSAARFFYSAKAASKERRDSKHPTVKPVKLMQWLVRLITPPGGMVLDPFAGTGTTGEACKLEGFDCTLIEREAEYAADIRKRIPDIQVET